jgi:two-component system alkaline phosphatase synthesis response regulator PhoP
MSETSPMAYRILVVDDDHQIVRVVRSYLEEAGMRVFVAYSGDEAMRFIRHERPDLVILDLMLPERDGWEITRQMRADGSLALTPVLMLTARVEDTDKIRGLELGADDYLTKPFNPLEVVARVRAILRRATGDLAAPRVLEVGALRLDVDRHQVSVAGCKVDVTGAEFSLLKMLMENPNRVFTRSELIVQAFGYAYEGMERTIDAHVKNLRKKLGDDPARPHFIETVYGVGYCLREEPSR